MTENKNRGESDPPLEGQTVAKNPKSFERDPDEIGEAGATYVYDGDAELGWLVLVVMLAFVVGSLFGYLMGAI